MTGESEQVTIHIRRRTYLALKRLREDRSYPTFDMLIREMLEKLHPELDV